MFWFFSILTIIVVLIQFVNHFYYSQGKLDVSYPLSIIAYSIYIVIETVLAFNHPEQISILLFDVVNLWALLMAIKGWKRLNDNKK